MNAKALHKMSYGLYIVSSILDGKLNGQTADAAMQVTSEPKRITVALNKKNLTHSFVKESGFFSLSVLSKECPFKFIGRFGFRSGRDVNKCEGVNHRIGETGAPIVLDNCVAYADVDVIGSLDVGTHTLFVGEVKDCNILGDEEPMTYDYYHKIKGGKLPDTAATYIKEESSQS